MPDLGLFDDNERVERSDVELLGDEIPRGVMAQLPAQVLTNPAGQTSWIFSGFEITNPALKQCRVDRGVATLSMREGGAVKPGMITHEGDAFLIVDLAGKPNGTYGVFIRFEFKQGSFLNRIFWAGAGEASQNIATRRIAGWGLACALVSPGAEWFKIGEVVVSGAATLTVTPQRQFYFEGDESDGYANGWGSGDDRDADRATHGVKDMQTFVQAITTQMSVMIGSGKKWFEVVVEGLEQKLSKAGPDTAQGPITVTDGVIADVLGTLSASGSSARSTPRTNYLDGANIPKAWGTIFSNGNGSVAVLSGTDGFLDGFNIEEVEVTDAANGVISVTFASAMSNNLYCVVASAGRPSFPKVHARAGNKTSQGFDLFVAEDSDNVNLAAATTEGEDIVIDFVVFGRQ